MRVFHSAPVFSLLAYCTFQFSPALCIKYTFFFQFLLKSLQHTVFARKILNDLSSDAPGVPRIEEEKSEEETAAPAIATVTVPTPIYQTSSGQYSM